MDWTGCKWVESVPGKMSGVPVLIRSRMPADGVLENFDDGMTAAEIAEDYELDIETVEGALAFARRLEHSSAA
jgi:uncharacterized protein (DUF433 family)